MKMCDLLACHMHKVWSKWFKYLLGRCTINANGTATIPKNLLDRWMRQAKTPYGALTIREQLSDKAIAYEILIIMRGEPSE